jgi:hypothetical protein
MEQAVLQNSLRNGDCIVCQYLQDIGEWTHLTKVSKCFACIGLVIRTMMPALADGPLVCYVDFNPLHNLLAYRRDDNLADLRRRARKRTAPGVMRMIAFVGEGGGAGRCVGSTGSSSGDL